MEDLLKKMNNMVVHYIITGSSYRTGRRIALDVASYESIDKDKVDEIKKYLDQERIVSNSISIHVVQTDSLDFDSVKEYDGYFKNVTLIKTKEEFAKLINMDRYVTGLDVARYILTKVPCTHLKIQKLTYLCYADYLCEKNEKLFEDKIYAYTKGPVVKSVYKKYKKSMFFIHEEDDKEEYSKKEKYLPIRSRILASENGVDKVFSIDKTIEKYGNLSGEELVELTHKKDSPWEHSGKGKKRYQRMCDETIKKYHNCETI